MTLHARRRVRTVYAAEVHCLFCSASGLGDTGWTDTCPRCQASPASKAWHIERAALTAAMTLEAIAQGLPAGRIVITPPLAVLAARLGKEPA